MSNPTSLLTIRELRDKASRDYIDFGKSNILETYSSIIEENKNKIFDDAEQAIRDLTKINNGKFKNKINYKYSSSKLIDYFLLRVMNSIRRDLLYIKNDLHNEIIAKFPYNDLNLQIIFDTESQNEISFNVTVAIIYSYNDN